MADGSRPALAVIVTAPLSLPVRSWESYDTPMAEAARLAAAGVRFCIGDAGTSGAAMNARNLPHHAAMAAAYGLDRAEALRAITLYPARILGVGDQVGSIEPANRGPVWPTAIRSDHDPVGGPRGRPCR